MENTPTSPKRLAVVASGWHFPLHFFKAMAAQKVPDGWTVDLFCISHRDPSYSVGEKKERLARIGWSYPEVLDQVLYKDVASVEDIEKLGWTYELCPNTVGDYGNVNQWLERHDYRDYDMLLMTHDDNLLLNDRLFTDNLQGELPWVILTNASGSAENWREFVKVRILGRALNIRGSFEFIKTELFGQMGGKFDMTGVTLSREGEFSSPESFKSLNNWNMTALPFRHFLDKHGYASKIKSLSNTYRVSDYCIEGERGFVSSIQKADKRLVLKGLRRVQQSYARSLFKS